MGNDNSIVLKNKIRSMLLGKKYQGTICIYDSRWDESKGRTKRKLLNKIEFDDTGSIGDIEVEIIYNRKQVEHNNNI